MTSQPEQPATNPENSTHTWPVIRGICDTFSETLTNAQRLEFLDEPLWQQTDDVCTELVTNPFTRHRAVNLRSLYLVHSLEKNIVAGSPLWKRWLSVNDPFWASVDSAFLHHLNKLTSETHGVQLNSAPSEEAAARLQVYEYELVATDSHRVRRRLMRAPSGELTSVVYVARPN